MACWIGWDNWRQSPHISSTQKKKRVTFHYLFGLSRYKILISTDFIPRSMLGGALFFTICPRRGFFLTLSVLFRPKHGWFCAHVSTSLQTQSKAFDKPSERKFYGSSKIMTPVQKPCAGNRRKRKLHNGDKVHGYLRETNSIVG